jgi:hypothetical protein
MDRHSSGTITKNPRRGENSRDWSTNRRAAWLKATSERPHASWASPEANA